MCFTDGAEILVRFLPFAAYPQSVPVLNPVRMQHIVVENKVESGISPGAEAIRRALAELEAECDRRRDALMSDLRTLEGCGDRTYLRMSPSEAIEQFLKDNPGPHHISEVTEKLVKLGVKLGGGKKSPIWVAKITVSQKVFKHIFRYSRKTGIVSLVQGKSA